jgi:delta-1-pyrroline-5-carboxylate synthetase
LFNVQVAEAMAIQAKQTESIVEAGVDAGPEAMARSAREQSRILAALPTEERSAMLRRIADALEAKIDDIMAANQEDIKAATGRIDNNLLQRLVMKPSKVSQLAEGIRQLASMDEPIGQLLSRTEIAKARSSPGK